MHSKYDNWQPMATAPTDGTEITVLYVHLCSENCYGKKQGLCSDKCEGCFLPPMEHAASYDVSAGLHMCEFRTPILWKHKDSSKHGAEGETPEADDLLTAQETSRMVRDAILGNKGETFIS